MRPPNNTFIGEMQGLLTDPDDVLLLVGPATDPESIRSLAQRVAREVHTVDRVEDAAEVLEDTDDVGCVLAASVDETTFGSLQEVVRDVDSRLPIVVVSRLDPALVRAVARDENARFLPSDAPEDELEEVVDDAIAAFARRRDEYADSTILQKLLADGQMTIFAKDRQARYVRMADVPDTPDPEDALGKTDVEVYDYDEETATAALTDDLSVIETGETVRNRLERYEGRGGPHWSETTKLPWNVDGEIAGVVGYVTDATEREALRERVEKQQQRFEKFASYVSHDLRTPLQVIVGALEQARHGDEGALDRIERSAERIEQIIDDLSALSKGEGGMEKLSPEVLEALDVGVDSTDLVDLVENVWKLRQAAEATLELEVPDGTVVVTEAETLRPLFENLLKNAVEHAGPDVTVRVGTIDRGFYVEDDGPGIPADERQKVLEEGYTTSEEGTGTGLAIVKETLSQQRWKLAITDSEAGGARFEITNCPVVEPIVATPGDAVELTESTDVGDVSLPGEANYDEATDTWTVVGDGTDIWQEVDEFHFVHGEVTGPVRIETRIADFEGVHEYSKAGLMVRNGLDEGEPLGFVGATRGHGTETLWRRRSAGDADSIQFEEPYGSFQHYRLDAIDGTVTMFFSTDGEDWQPLDQIPIELGDSIQVGLAVCSHDSDETSEARFEGVEAFELDAE